MKEIKLNPKKAIEMGFLEESNHGDNIYLLNGRKIVIDPEDDFVVQLYEESFEYQMAGDKYKTAVKIKDIIDKLESAKQENKFHVGSANWAIRAGYNEGLDEAIELLKKAEGKI